ncbi:Niemann-Pick C1-like protein 1 [Numida meleagris]|uniref:Niemann-Pick C1-like protein 1 n=1 Tax=Numida meleagris TaxID=8996 RepID=UPI000B3E37E4|nr:Niemann-Pick C1-like protein 1 [Numida meleagris]
MVAAPALAGTVLGALLALAAPELTLIHRAGYCAFYGNCGRNPELNNSLVGTDVPCLSNTPARLASAPLLAVLRSVCPELVRGDNSTRVCCSLAQLSALQLSVALSGAVLSRCPSCARNFANLHCNNICSPDQSLFINVTRVVNRTTALGLRQEAVVEYQCFYERGYAEAAFDSCIGVRLPATGGYALDTMCGIYGARLCTAQRWLDFQGDTSNGLAPLRIRFRLLPNGTGPGAGVEPLSGSPWPCVHPSSPLSFMDITALEMSCMAAYGAPVFPYIAFGGYPGSEYTEAEALILTYSLTNFPAGDARQRWVLSWERRFLAVLRRFQSEHSANLSVTFMAERSLEDELNRTAAQDVPVLALSYLLVFAYVALALGEYTAWRRLLVGRTAAPIPTAPSCRLTCPNVCPKRVPSGCSWRAPHGCLMGAPGRRGVLPPAGSLSSMPAVRTFALTAAVAIAFDFLLQMSGFVALLALDTRRQEVLTKIPLEPMKDPVGFPYAGSHTAPTHTLLGSSSHSDPCWIPLPPPVLTPPCPFPAAASCLLGQCMNSTRRPTVDEFQRFLPWFLHDRPTLECAKGGLGAYDTAVSMDGNGTILASRFMAYQRPLRTSQDYTAALRAARALADTITATLRRVPGTNPDFRVFPYTLGSGCPMWGHCTWEWGTRGGGSGTWAHGGTRGVAHGPGTRWVTQEVAQGHGTHKVAVAFEAHGVARGVWGAQEVTRGPGTRGVARGHGDPRVSPPVTSPVSPQAIGISVEFVSHLTCAFAQSTRPTRVERAAEATVNMGSKVVAGVAMTNLPGVVVLAFAKAQLIQIFFFRLNFIITLVGLAHGLVFLPVLLSYMGPSPLLSAEDTEDTKAGAVQDAAIANPGFKDAEPR